MPGALACGVDIDASNDYNNSTLSVQLQGQVSWNRAHKMTKQVQAKFRPNSWSWERHEWGLPGLGLACGTKLSVDVDHAAAFVCALHMI